MKPHNKKLGPFPPTEVRISYCIRQQTNIARLGAILKEIEFAGFQLNIGMKPIFEGIDELAVLL